MAKEGHAIALITGESPIEQSMISETFMPDVHSPSFQQPKSEMNAASGFPRFAKQSVLIFTKSDAINLEQEMRLSIKNSIDEIKTTLSQTKSQVAGCINTVETMQESVTRHAVTMEEVKL